MSLKVLELGHNSFSGSPSVFFGQFRGLERINLESNSLTGSIPTSIGNHSSLKFLSVVGNYLNGRIPESIGQLVNLEVLDVSHNLLNGRIPKSIGQLANLESLAVSHNLLNGRIPNSIGQLSNLEILDVSHNLLGGVLSELHFARLRSLRHLNMENNPLHFHVDSTWVPPFQLEWISLSSCNVGPEFPQWLKFQKNISYIGMSNSSISNRIPDWFESISSSIVALDLSHNLINKNLPRLRGLNNYSAYDYQRFILLQYNNFDGPLITFPSDVTALDLSNNLLSGHIPQNFGSMMPNLQFLFLSNNHLNGSISTSVCKMVGLEFLDLSRNQFSERLPSCWNEMQELRVLDLANNNLTGLIPISLGSLQWLHSLHLQHNKFQGNFPPLTELKWLKTLDLSGNAFSGSLPRWIGGRLSELRVLNIRSNKFGDEIPLQLCRLRSLRILILANNMLNGTIPPCFQKLTAMIESSSSVEFFWDYHPYFLDGAQPAGYNESVKASIKGIELEYTKSIRYLFSIDMSENNFSGDIPKVLMRLSGLRNLNLSGNKLAGHIPLEIGNLKLLESLDLSRNELSGSIPSTISELNFLSFLNVSFNNLSGRIPEGNQLQTLTDKSIYMGNGALCGPPLKSCPEDELPNLLHEMKEDSEMPWFYCGLAFGLLTGFVGVCSILYFKNSWRYAWFKLVDDIYIKLSVMAAAKANQLRQNLNT